MLSARARGLYFHYFVPYNEDAIGKLDTTTDTFSTIAMTPTQDGKYGGGVAVGTTVYFTPVNEDAIGKLETYGA